MNVVGPGGQQILSKEQQEQIRQQQAVLALQSMSFQIAAAIVGANYQGILDGQMSVEVILDHAYDYAEQFLGHVPSKYKNGNEGSD